MKTIDNFNFEDKKILIRVDFNVPIDKYLKIQDDTRIQLSIPTIKKVLHKGGKIILISHMGKPNGIFSYKYSLKNIVSRISSILNMNIKFYHKCVGEEVENYIDDNLKKQEIILLENLRFHKEEELGNIEFAKKLYKLGDIYINESFSCAHRAHSSNYILPKFFQKKCFGYLFEKELKVLSNFFLKKEKPITFILGGSKISSKINMIDNILPKIDYLLIGGGMVFTFLKAKGYNIGNSIVEENYLETAKKIIDKAIKNNVLLYLPDDIVVSNKIEENSIRKICSVNNIYDGYIGLDIGPNTIEKFDFIIRNSKTIFWNGPMGMFEIPTFSIGTTKLMHSIINSTQKGAYSLIGGGDSIASVNKLNLKNRISYVSSGGGAMISLLEGKKLPGIISMYY